MARKVVTLESDAEYEDWLRQHASFLGEMNDLAATAPDGSVLHACEVAVLEKGREQQRLRLQRATQNRIAAAKKKGDAENLFMWSASPEPSTCHP